MTWQCDRSKVDPVVADSLDVFGAVDPTDWAVICGARPNSEQAEDYQKGRTPFADLAELMASDPMKSIVVADDVVTDAKPGQSPHNCTPSEACDLAEMVDGKIVQDYLRPCWPRLYAFVRASIHLHSGMDFPGTFKDPPHVQRVNWENFCATHP